MSEEEAGLLVLLVVPVLWALMWWGWRRRSRRQVDVPVPPTAPTDPGEALLEPREGVYVSSTTEADWLDRVVAHGLGRRSACEVGVFAGGVSLAREGEDVLWLPADRLQRVRRERGMAGKYVDREGLVVLTWLLGPGDELALDTGVRLRRHEDADALVAAVAELLARAVPRRRSVQEPVEGSAEEPAQGGGPAAEAGDEDGTDRARGGSS